VTERQRGELFAPRGKEWIVAAPPARSRSRVAKTVSKVAFGARVQDMEFEPKAINTTIPRQERAVLTACPRRGRSGTPGTGLNGSPLGPRSAPACFSYLHTVISVASS